MLITLKFKNPLEDDPSNLNLFITLDSDQLTSTVKQLRKETKIKI
jgi:hypothetical protein